MQTQAEKLESIKGTANQVLVNGTSGSEQKGDITLTLPQDINTSSNVGFAHLTLSSLASGSSNTNILVSGSDGAIW